MTDQMDNTAAFLLEKAAELARDVDMYQTEATANRTKARKLIEQAAEFDENANYSRDVLRGVVQIMRAVGLEVPDNLAQY